MKLDEIMEKRRAYRSLEKIEISEKIIREIAEEVRLAPSCFNYQPWNFIFVTDKEMLDRITSEMMSKSNDWTKRASTIVAVFSKKKDDCVVKNREYFLFDTGMATAYLILKATDMGLVAHPIAGYDEDKTKEILNIPEEYTLITLLIIGKHSEEINELLTDKQAEIEKNRPERKKIDEFIYQNKYESD
ncbi:MAG: nitroreductase family protein [Thermoplasmatota archaeon]